MALKYFTVSPDAPNAITLEIISPTKTYTITCKGPTELGRVVQFAIKHGYQFHLKNGVDLAWVQQVRENINAGYVYPENNGAV